MTALKRVLRYLKGKQDLALTYMRETTPALVAFSDADWAGDTETRRSTSGSVFLMCGAAVTWASRKQASIALSTIEAEYMALSLAAQEAMWLLQFDTEINCAEPEATLIWEDNTGTIAVAKNPVFSMLRFTGDPQQIK